MRYRQGEEVATGMPIPRVHADNKEELRRIRALVWDRKLEEREAVRREREAAAAAYYRNFPVEPQPALQRREREQDWMVHERRREAQQAAAMQVNRAVAQAAAMQANRAVAEAARVEAAAMQADRRLVVPQNVRIEWDEEDQRQEELRRVQALQNHALEGAPPLPDLIRDVRNMQVPRWRVGLNEPGGAGGVLVTANDEALARMVALPVLRKTAVEATECPICMEELGEVGKTVLKCGHTVCVSCFLQQIMRATAVNNVNKCECSVCRVNYII